jgi:hypothetical protein
MLKDHSALAANGRSHDDSVTNRRTFFVGIRSYRRRGSRAVSLSCFGSIPMAVLGSQMFRAAIATLFVGCFASPAYAYLDAGTGSMILQVLLGGAAGLALAGKLYWHKLLSLIGIRRDAKAPGEARRDGAADQRG